MTIDADFQSTLTAPMHAMLTNALTPYLDGDLDAGDDLVDSLLDIIAAADRTPALISTLHQAISALTPTPELMSPMHQAIGAALELTPASARPATSSYSGSQASYPNPARTNTGSSRPGSIADSIKRLFANNPGQTYRVGDLVKALGGHHSGGAVGAALTSMTTRGEAVLVGDKPKLYLAADDPTLTPDPEQEQGPDTTTPDTTPHQTPADQAHTDEASADQAPAEQAPATRRGNTKK